jgi:ABC-2 type transport system ATP-binding protein
MTGTEKATVDTPALTGEGLDARLMVERGSFRLDVTLSAAPGDVLALLGPNGAGKTTTLRCLLGLVTPTAGTATVDGRAYRDLPDPMRTVGAALEASSFHPGRSARAHLEAMALAGGLPKQRVGEVLGLVGMAEFADRRVGGYSLGMRQRLALAQALLGDPSVLILDEPANGLDPAGIRWMRGLLKSYAERGGTVLLSSHLLNEVELIADEMILIGRGKIVAQGDKKSLLAERGSNTHVVALDNTSLEEALDAYDVAWTPVGDAIAVDAEPVEVGRIAAEKGIVLVELRHADGGLENLFLELTSDAQRDEIKRDDNNPGEQA